MRLVKLDTLKSGAHINMAIKKANGQILLPAGALLTERYISRLKGFGFNAVYIDDDLFNSVEAVPALTDETKTFALNSVDSFFRCCSKGQPLNVNAVKETGKKIYDDVHTICSNPISLFNLFVVDDLRCLHSVNVAVMTAALAAVSNLKPEIAKDITTAALLHDIMVEDIKEPEDHEYPTQAMEYLKSQHGLSTVTYMSVAAHHEQYDGMGYPRKLKKDSIYVGARLISICDVYDNLLNGLSGYKKMTEYHALEYINGHSGSLFDPDIVALFNKTVAIYPTGATVMLDNGSSAIVIRQNSGMPSRPVVRLLMDKWEDCLEFDLLSSKTLFIKKVDL